MSIPFKVGQKLLYESRFHFGETGGRRKVEGVVIDVIRKCSPMTIINVAPLELTSFQRHAKSSNFEFAHLFEVFAGITSKGIENEFLIETSSNHQERITVSGEMFLEEMLTHGNEHIRKAGQRLKKQRKRMERVKAKKS